jgi:heterogeneous nuclear rnp K-like protein 2
MSASPTLVAVAPSTKRPLEDPSSEAGLNDQPEAKRPALDTLRDDAQDDKALKTEIKTEDVTNGASEDPSIITNADGMAMGGTVKVEDIDTKPIESTANGTSSGQGFPQQDESQWLHVRAIISSAEAATVIGKGGENVTLIRRMSGAKCTVSDYTRGAVERVLTVSGLVDAVAKVSSPFASLHCNNSNTFAIGLRSHHSHPQP